MKIEAKLALNNMKKNKKRTIYTTISLVLCTLFILTTIILISSIRNGISENFDSEYNDYHVVLTELSAERFNKIKNNSYIDKIYIQENEYKPLKTVDSSYIPQGNITVYLKYNNIQKVCEYSNDILKQLNLSETEKETIQNNLSFNQKLLTVHGLIDANVEKSINNSNVNCVIRVNYSYIIELMIISVIAIFSILFIIILYNAFLIKINERKKEYAILNSVGGTEGQVLTLVFIEAILMGIIAIIIGGLLSALSAKAILNSLNSILLDVGYYFRFAFNTKYIILSLIIISINIFLSILIPSIKASKTSIIQGIRNNKQIKYKGKKNILEKLLPIEGKLAIKNIKRNKNKYRVITILMIVCITSFIAISTYIHYEKETADIVKEYDVDAELFVIQENRLEDYKAILENYKNKYDKNVEYIEYREMYGNQFLIKPNDSLLFSRNEPFTYIDNSKSIDVKLIALNEKTYMQYIKKINANYGDFIIYNNILTNADNSKKGQYNYTPAFKQGVDLKLNLIRLNYISDKNQNDYEIIGHEFFDKNYILTDEAIGGFKDVQIKGAITLFINMETYDKINNYIEQNYPEAPNGVDDSEYSIKRNFWINNKYNLRLRINCNNITEFKDYMEEFGKKQNIEVTILYYSLENQEKLIYIAIIELILKVMMIAICSITIVSTINIINASLVERKEDFNILYRLGTTKGNIRKMLIYEGIYMFLKTLVISIIISVPIIYAIVKQTEKIVIINKLLVPFGEIGIFVAILFAITIFIMIYSSRMVKEE